VIYMSGYADEALAQYEIDASTVFLRKPFTPGMLARAVRDALAADRGDRDAGSSAAD
jgi:FixJ family two-component response regulator